MNAMILVPGKPLYLMNIWTGMPDNSGKVVLDPATDEAAFRAIKVYFRLMPDDAEGKDELRRAITKWTEGWRQWKEMKAREG